MSQAAPEATHDGYGKINQAAGHPCAAHDFGGQDKQWHRHKSKNIKLGKNTLR